jgi:hypothetical protein
MLRQATLAGGACGSRAQLDPLSQGRQSVQGKTRNLQPARARILERLFAIVKRRNKSGVFTGSEGFLRRARVLFTPDGFVPPARPGESRCPGGRRRCRNRARWPLFVTVATCAMEAVSGAVIGAVTPAPAVTGSVPAVTAVAGRPSLSLRAGRPGPLPLATPEQLAHETLACATEVAITPGGTSRHVRVSRPLLPRLRPRRYPRDLTSPRTPCQSCRCGQPGPQRPP